MKKIKKVLIANRGVPAFRVIHTCRDNKIETTAVYSTPDRLATHVFLADNAIHIGEAPPIESYLNKERIINAAFKSKSDAIHPGWGFLAENHEFAQMVIDAGLTWIGPAPETIRLMGDKIQAKNIAVKAGVPVIPGINGIKHENEILDWMKKEKVKYPIILKASKGGGGKGMVKVNSSKELSGAISQAASEAKKAFGDDELLAEKYIEYGRHIEVQIVADKFENYIHLFERECTLQRRNQKIIEEAPSPSISKDLRKEICEKALDLMRAIKYESAGTVEFLFDPSEKKFYFLEVNTRLQVEHGITELITGLDIVRIMLDVAQGKKIGITQPEVIPNRWALEARINAEDPKTFNPSFGRISRLQIIQAHSVRISQGVYEGAEVPPYYDSLIMLVMTSGPTRQDAIAAMDRTLSRNLRIEGIKTLTPLLLSLIRHKSFQAGDFSTRFIEQHIDELVSGFDEISVDDELLKISQYVAEISALGPQEWM
ncbi:MAG: ATP-grasp domain-containing protein [Spirochaetia bacterium]|nr:ATP-grasp domain-containing protein [Spirochaetia bacterium]